MRRVLLLMLILGLAAVSIPAVHAASPGEEWGMLKAELAAAEDAETLEESLAYIENATSIYLGVFQAPALANDPEDDKIITEMLANSEDQLRKENVDQAKLNRQAIDKTIYKIAYHEIENAISANDAERLLEWFTVMEAKFKFSESDYATNAVLAEIASSGSISEGQGDIIKSDILGIFRLKTFEEIEEAIHALRGDDTEGAKKFAYEGRYYYRTLHPDLDARLGSEKSGDLLRMMEEVIAITESDRDVSEKITELQDILSGVEVILAEYEGGDTSRLGLVLSGIRDRLNLVDIEYRDAVKDGNIVNQKEYDETVVFLAKAVETLDANFDEIAALSESDASEVMFNLEEIDGIVSSHGDESEVTILVGRSLNNMATLQELAGGAVEKDTLEYIDRITDLLKQARAAYASGDAETAFDLVSEAYLDNYEFVEGPLGELDRHLMLKIETDMREKLRGMISSGAPADEVDAQIGIILEDLEIARQVVPEFGTIAALILVIATVSVIAITSRSRLGIASAH